MIGMEVEEIDIFVISAIKEIANIICGHALNEFESSEEFNDITTPDLIEDGFFSSEKASLQFDSEIGGFQVFTSLK